MNAFRKSIKQLRDNDPILANIITEVGECTLSPSKDYFKSLVKSIVHQQISVSAGRTIYNRLEGETNGITPSNILNLNDGQFKKAGISSQKRGYIIDLAKKFKYKEISTEKMEAWTNEEIIDHLTKIKGIGRWTAEMFLIFSLNRPNVLPLDDLGLQRAIMINYNLKANPSKEKIVEISKNWGNCNSIATWYLWQSVNKNIGNVRF